MDTERGLLRLVYIAAGVLFAGVGCNPFVATEAATHPRVLDSVQVVGASGETVNARSFALGGIVNVSSDSFDIELAVDPGTTTQRVDTFRARPFSSQFADLAPFPGGRRWLLLHRDTLTNGRHTIRVVFVGQTRDTVSLSIVRQVVDVDYDAQALPGIGGTDSFGADLNASGVAVGQAADQSGAIRAVRWVAGVPTALSDIQSSAAAINEQGAIAGQYAGNVVIWDSTGQHISSVVGRAYDIDSRGRVLLAYTADLFRRVAVLDSDSLIEVAKCSEALLRSTGVVDLSSALNTAYRTAPVDLGEDGSVLAFDNATKTITVWRDGVVTGARIPAG
jgi:hypothetical protein